MTCTRCGKPSRVTETRHPESHPRTWLGKIKQAGEVATWYTPDVIMRRRVCPDGHSWFTVELSTDDVRQMVEEGMP
jgi:hypothetical protein